jgi:hypothetical protein
VIGFLNAGDDFNNSHVSFAKDADWMFISTIRRNAAYAPDIGWVQAPNIWEQCKGVAG